MTDDVVVPGGAVPGTYCAGDGAGVTLRLAVVERELVSRSCSWQMISAGRAQNSAEQYVLSTA